MNPYQPSYAPMGAEVYGRPSQGVINQLRRGGFWASFLGWICVVLVLLMVVAVMMLPTPPTRTKSPDQELFEQRFGEIQDTSPTREVPQSVALLGGGIIIVSIVSLLASLGMVVMLLWFGGSTKTLLRTPSFEQLHRVAIVQRRLWICIGLYCLCSILYFVLSISTIVTVFSQMFS